MTAARGGAILAVAALTLILATGGGPVPSAAPFLPPSLAHPFGTDDLGRDLLSAVIAGGRTSLLVGALSVTLALAIGTGAGLIAGLGPRALDETVMRTADMVASVPALLVAILVAGLHGGSALALALVLGATRWPVVARIVRAETASLLRMEHARAAIALGVGPAGLARRHLLPHIGDGVLPVAGILFGGAILAESTMSFVGLGDPDRTSWGRLVADGSHFLDRAWWGWAFPALAIVSVSALVAVAADVVPHRGRVRR